MNKLFVFTISLCLLSIISCENPNLNQNVEIDKMRLQIVDIPAKYNGCMVNVIILDNEDNEIAYCGGNFENESVITVYATDKNDDYWTGEANESYKVSLTFLYDDDPDALGFYFVDAILLSTFNGGEGTVTISATGTIFNEYAP